MQITRNSLDTGPGPADWFTGAVFLDTVAAPRRRRARGRQRPLHAWRPHRLAHPPQRPDDLRDRGGRPLPGRGGPVEEIRPGDRVYFEPGESTGTAPPQPLHGAHRHPEADETGNSSPGATTSATRSTGRRPRTRPERRGAPARKPRTRARRPARGQAHSPQKPSTISPSPPSGRVLPATSNSRPSAPASNARPTSGATRTMQSGGAGQSSSAQGLALSAARPDRIHFLGEKLLSHQAAALSRRPVRVAARGAAAQND